MSSANNWIDECLDGPASVLSIVKLRCGDADKFHLGCYDVAIYGCLEGFTKSLLINKFKQLRRLKRPASSFNPEFVAWRAPNFEADLRKCVSLINLSAAPTKIAALVGAPLRFNGLKIAEELNQVNSKQIEKIARSLSWNTTGIQNHYPIINALLVDRNNMAHRAETTKVSLKQHRILTMQRVIAVTDIIECLAIEATK